MQYLHCLNPEELELKVGVAFAYGDLMQCDVQNKPKLVLGDVGSLTISDEKNGADDNVPRNTDSAEMTGERKKTFLWMYGPSTP